MKANDAALKTNSGQHLPREAHTKKCRHKAHVIICSQLASVRNHLYGTGPHTSATPEQEHLPSFERALAPDPTQL
jgi:hypothetical protein